MTKEKTIKDTELQREIAALAGRRAENLFNDGGLCCAESVLLTINNGFQGGLSPEMAKSLGSGFCGGIGDSGCLCGALAGAIMALGLFVSPARLDGLRKNKFRKLSKTMHDRFNDDCGSTCCRVLIKDYVNDRRARAKNCMGLTGKGAELATELLLDLRPELLNRVDMKFLQQQDRRISSLLRVKVPNKWG